MKKSPEKNKKFTDVSQEVPPAVQIFSRTRDMNGEYHLDGDMEMYSEEKLEIRESLRVDPDIRKELEQLVNMYKIENDCIHEQEYKRMQRKLALALRPNIEQEELDFVVDEDWNLDQEEGVLRKDELYEKLFEMVDVWTIGVDKSEYISFIKLLCKKVKNIKD